MKQGFVFAALLAAAALCSPARAGELAVLEAWARATPPAAAVAAAYLTIDNGAGGADRLLGASSDAAGRVEVHESRREGEVMRMRKVEPLDIPAGERVVFAPGGLHVMLMDLKAPLRQGEKLPLVLRFEHAGAVQVEAEVLAGDATDPHAGHHHH
jgi:copper(I)-binding protein